MHLAFTKPLPGKKAQAAMAPEYRRLLLLQEYFPETAASAAVLVMLLPANEGRSVDELLEWSVLLTRRPAHLGTHAGQIAFPGGKREEGDPSLWATACREAYEEVGVLQSCLEKIGPLTRLYIPPSNFIVQPFVAVAQGSCELHINEQEVIDYKYIPLGFFNPACAKQVGFEYGKNDTRLAPAWEYEDYLIWGATAMVLAELYSVIQRRP